MTALSYRALHQPCSSRPNYLVSQLRVEAAVHRAMLQGNVRSKWLYLVACHHFAHRGYYWQPSDFHTWIDRVKSLRRRYERKAELEAPPWSDTPMWVVSWGTAAAAAAAKTALLSHGVLRFPPFSFWMRWIEGLLPRGKELNLPGHSQHE